MFAGLLAVMLTATPVRGPVLLVSPGLTAKDAAPQAVSYASNALVRKLEDEGVRVALPEHVTQRLGADEAQRLLGCELAEPSCLEALATATRADGVLTGQLQQDPKGYTLRLQVRGSRSGEVLAEETVSGFGMSQLEQGLQTAARKVAPLLSRTLGAPLEPRESVRYKALLPASAGLALTGVGTMFLLSANNTHSRLMHPTSATDPTPTEAVELVSRGKRQQLLGGAFLGAGLAAGGYAAYLFLRSETRAPTNPLGVALVPTPRGFAVAGVLP